MKKYIKQLKEKMIKEFPFTIEDGILNVWERVPPDGDWDSRIATIDDLKKYFFSKLTELECVIKKEYKKAAESAYIENCREYSDGYLTGEDVLERLARIND